MDNINLWFAKDENGTIVTIDEIDRENKGIYYCPLCGSEVIARTGDRKTWHFAHIDKSKCSSESMIHFWVKNKLLKENDKVFINVNNSIEEFICKEILIEQSYNTSLGIYKPDITMITYDNKTIFFEIAKSNKKKIKDYIDIWNELNNIVVEVNTSELLNGHAINVFKSINYKKYKFDKNTNKTIKKVCRRERVDYKKYQDNLSWILNDCYKYIHNEIEIDELFYEINNLKDKYIYMHILKDNEVCNTIYNDLRRFEEKLAKQELLKLQELYKENVKIEFSETYNSFSVHIYSNMYNNAYPSKKENRDLNKDWRRIYFYYSSHIDYTAIEGCKKEIEKHIDCVNRIIKRNNILKSDFLKNSLNDINNYIHNIDSKYLIKRDNIEFYEVRYTDSSKPSGWEDKINFHIEYKDNRIAPKVNCIYQYNNKISINLNDIDNIDYEYLYNCFMNEFNKYRDKISQNEYTDMIFEYENYIKIVKIINRMFYNYNPIRDFGFSLLQFNEYYIRLTIEQTQIYTVFTPNKIIIEKWKDYYKEPEFETIYGYENIDDIFNKISNMYSDKIRNIKYNKQIKGGTYDK